MRKKSINYFLILGIIFLYDGCKPKEDTSTTPYVCKGCENPVIGIFDIEAIYLAYSNNANTNGGKSHIFYAINNPPYNNSNIEICDSTKIIGLKLKKSTNKDKEFIYLISMKLRERCVLPPDINAFIPPPYSADILTIKEK